MLRHPPPPWLSALFLLVALILSAETTIGRTSLPPAWWCPLESIRSLLPGPD